MATLQVSDATASGQKLHTFTLDHLAERLTVRELIRARIYQEVQDHNRSGATLFRGLVQPTDTERTLNGFFVLVGDRQAEGLDEAFAVTPETEVSFVKLVPLVGG
jgi:hypothetical protein